MSTRSIIARVTPEGWEGRYHHFDGYPTGLGETLFILYDGFFKRDTNRMTKYLIDDHPAGWSTINDCDFGLPPGFSSALAASSRIAPRCYCHGTRRESPYLYTQDTDPSAIEWLYVISPATLSVYKTITTSFDDPEGIGGDPDFMGHAINPQKFVCVAVLIWGDKPDWEHLESRGYEMANHARQRLISVIAAGPTRDPDKETSSIRRGWDSASES